MDEEPGHEVEPQPSGRRWRRPSPARAVLVVLVIVSLILLAIGGGLPALFGSDALGVDLVSAGVHRSEVDPASAGVAGSAIDAFGVDLYGQVAGSDGNVVFSPTSIAFSLALARPGAMGRTAMQMDAVTYGIASDAHADWLNALDGALARRSGPFKDAGGQDVSVALRLADAAFAQKGMAIVPAYLDALAARFGVGLRVVDYTTDAEAARLAIDSWVSSKTDGRITDLIAPGGVDALTRLVLVNAIYLNAAWAIPFDPRLTSPRPFTTGSGALEQAPTMASSGPMDVGYASGAGWQAVDLPYAGNELAMTVILPDDMPTFEGAMTPETLASITAAVTERASIHLWLPRFSIDTRTDLSQALGALGMTDAFSPDSAEFSGITTAERLWIARVVHQANISVGEKGTEASAATGTILEAVGRSLTPGIDVHVDHPFIFLVHDLATGTILFMGRVTDPGIPGRAAP